MRNLVLSFDGLVIILNPPLLHVCAPNEAPSEETAARLGPPKLRGGRRAQHLTIPFEPMRTGLKAGKLDVHLTYDPGEHVTIGLLDPAKIQITMASVQRDLDLKFRTRVAPITVDTLARKGYSIVLFSQTLQNQMQQALDHLPKRVRLKSAKLESLVEREVEYHPPQILDSLVDKTELHPLTAVQTSYRRRPFDLSVAYYKNGIPPHPPGWYAWPFGEWLMDAYEEALGTHAGPGFFDALLVAAREMQSDCDLDALLAARARAARIWERARQEAAGSAP